VCYSLKQGILQGHAATKTHNTVFSSFMSNIIIKQKYKKLILIDADRNVTQQEVQRENKYKSLGTEMQRTWNMKCKIIPVIF
jgi:hypothetical protein